MPLNVIVPLDGSAAAERAIGCGRALASASGGELVLVASAMHDDDYDDLARYVRNVEHSEAGRREILVRVEPAKAIDTVARRRAPSIVCMASHVRSGRTAAALGSVTAEVLAQGAGPVLVVGPAVRWTGATSCASVCLCADDSLDSLAGADAAHDFATTLGVPLRVLAVVERSDEAPGRHDTIRDGLRALGIDCEVDVLVSDDVVSALIDRAATPGAVLAVATRGRSRTSKFVSGSVALSIIGRAINPVLVVPPHRAARAWRHWTPGVS